MPFFALSSLWALIGGARGLFAAAGAAAIVWASLSAYDRLVDDPAVAAAARQDFVARAELEAEKAKSAEFARQVAAGQAALALEQRQREADEAEQAEQAKQREILIHVYETKLKEAGRSCGLTPADVDFLLKP